MSNDVKQIPLTQNQFALVDEEHSQNGANRRPKKNGTSKYLGVCQNKQNNKWKWQAHISKDKKQIRIGYFVNEIDAALAYNEKAIEIHGEFANLNKITA